MKLYLEDLHEGQRFTSGSLTVTAEAIKAFASEFDPQPFHLDETAAEASFFGGLAASGWHTAAMTMRLLVDGGLPLAGGRSAPGASSAGRGRRGRATCCTSRSAVEAVKPSRSRPDRGMLTVRMRDQEPARRSRSALCRERHRLPQATRPERRLHPPEKAARAAPLTLWRGFRWGIGSPSSAPRATWAGKC